MDQRLGGRDHRLISLLIRLLILPGVKQDLGLKRFALRQRKSELGKRNDFPGAFPDAHIADGEFARITPIAVEGWIFLVRRNRHEFVDHILQRLLTDALAEFLE